MAYFVIAGIVIAILMIAAEATIIYYIWALIVFAVAAVWYYIFVYLKFKHETSSTSSEDSDGITKVELLKLNVTSVNPFVFEMPVAGPHMTIYEALNSTFVDQGTVFSGKIDEFVALGVEYGLNEDDLRNGFDKLEYYGLIKIENGTFTPTQKYLDKFH